MRNGKDVTTPGSAPQRAASPDSESDTFANPAREAAAVGQHGVVPVFYSHLISILCVFFSDHAGLLLDWVCILLVIRHIIL